MSCQTTRNYAASPAAAAAIERLSAANADAPELRTVVAARVGTLHSTTHVGGRAAPVHRLGPPRDAHHANSPLRSHAIQRSGRATSGYGSRRVPRNWWTAIEQPG